MQENGSMEKPEPTPEEVEAIIRPQFSEAVKFALAALELSGMKDDDVADANGANHKSHDEYSKRPLPFLIGSKEFLEDDMIGLYVPEEKEEPEGTFLSSCIIDNRVLEPIDYVEGLPDVPEGSAPPPPLTGDAPPAPPPPRPSAASPADPFALDDEGPGLFGAESVRWRIEMIVAAFTCFRKKRICSRSPLRKRRRSQKRSVRRRKGRKARRPRRPRRRPRRSPRRRRQPSRRAVRAKTCLVRNRARDCSRRVTAAKMVGSLEAKPPVRGLAYEVKDNVFIYL